MTAFKNSEYRGSFRDGDGIDHEVVEEGVDEKVLLLRGPRGWISLEDWVVDPLGVLTHELVVEPPELKAVVVAVVGCGRHFF